MLFDAGLSGIKASGDAESFSSRSVVGARLFRRACVGNKYGRRAGRALAPYRPLAKATASLYQHHLEAGGANHR